MTIVLIILGFIFLYFFFGAKESKKNMQSYLLNDIDINRITETVIEKLSDYPQPYPLYLIRIYFLIIISEEASTYGINEAGIGLDEQVKFALNTIECNRSIKKKIFTVYQYVLQKLGYIDKLMFNDDDFEYARSSIEKVLYKLPKNNQSIVSNSKTEESLVVTTSSKSVDQLLEEARQAREKMNKLLNKNK